MFPHVRKQYNSQSSIYIYIYTVLYYTSVYMYIYIYFLLLYLSILHVCACDAARFGPVLVTNHTEGCVDLDLCMNTSICIYIYMYIITHRYQLLTLSWELTDSCFRIHIPSKPRLPRLGLACAKNEMTCWLSKQWVLSHSDMLCSSGHITHCDHWSLFLDWTRPLRSHNTCVGGSLQRYPEI